METKETLKPVLQQFEFQFNWAQSASSSHLGKHSVGFFPQALKRTEAGASITESQILWAPCPLLPLNKLPSSRISGHPQKVGGDPRPWIDPVPLAITAGSFRPPQAPDPMPRTWPWDVCGFPVRASLAVPRLLRVRLPRLCFSLRGRFYLCCQWQNPRDPHGPVSLESRETLFLLEKVLFRREEEQVATICAVAPFRSMSPSGTGPQCLTSLLPAFEFPAPSDMACSHRLVLLK